MIERILEVESMDTAEDAADYDAMDHAAVNRIFAVDFLVTVPQGFTGPALDVGTGTAQIPIELCNQSSTIHVVAVDLAESMLKLARRNIAAAGFADRITVEHVNARGLPYADGQFDAVVSNSIIHHIPEPFSVLKEMARVCCTGGRIFIRDLFRPDSKAELQRLVNMHAAGANDHQRQLFADSLHAALTVDEVRALIARLGFDIVTVQATSDRHWTWSAQK
jgi:ubiquinone/menaquinone biosynthesis C-methylase UbiE